MIFVVYAVRILVSTGLIYTSIAIVDRGNYRNKLSTAFYTAVFLSIAFQVPLFYWLGLVAWVYMLINWYSIGFFRSFLCAVVYAALFLLLNIILAGLLLGGAGLLSGGGFSDNRSGERTDSPNPAEAVHRSVADALKNIPQVLQKKSQALNQDQQKKEPMPQGRQVMVVLTNGRSIKGTILSEGADEYILDIANGGAEVVLRKDSVYRIEDI